MYAFGLEHATHVWISMQDVLAQLQAQRMPVGSLDSRTPRKLCRTAFLQETRKLCCNTHPRSIEVHDEQIESLASSRQRLKLTQLGPTLFASIGPDHPLPWALRGRSSRAQYVSSRWVPCLHNMKYANRTDKPFTDGFGLTNHHANA